jgi:hypothetical protein
MSLTLTLSDEQATVLRAKAAAESRSLDEWIEKLAERQPEPTAEKSLKTAADIIFARMRNVPTEIMATMPKDDASQHDHYIYGWPKREV